MADQKLGVEKVGICLTLDNEIYPYISKDKDCVQKRILNSQPVVPSSSEHYCRGYK